MAQNGGDADAAKRIKQMINFIKQEAQEKAEEIRVKAEEEFQIEKGRILNPERLKLDHEFDKKKERCGNPAKNRIFNTN